jgi:hypothetical protein
MSPSAGSGHDPRESTDAWKNLPVGQHAGFGKRASMRFRAPLLPLPVERQQNAWFYDGDGMKLMNEFGKKYNVRSLLAGGTGCQMGGWFRKEINEVADIRRLGSNHSAASLAGGPSSNGTCSPSISCSDRPAMPWRSP